MLHLQERRRLRLFLRRDDYGRFMSCLVYLPRDRYTTQMRLRMEEILREAFDGETRRLHRAGLRVGAGPRCTSSSASPDGAAIPDVDVDELEARLVEATRTWDDDFAESLRADVGEERGGALLPRYARRLPRGLQGGLPGARGGGRPRHVAP